MIRTISEAGTRREIDFIERTKTFWIVACMNRIEKQMFME